ncbi:MAG: DUF2752 domain-containing protein [Candidatus Azobacteroides sp.]|nr:DUF2752 domain-containing protein [Candidatus Azobacteroides sp.]
MHFIKTKIVIVAAVIVAGAVLLFFFNPEETRGLPKCPFYMLTGLKCPACGTQRAVYNLLHLNIQKAFYCNPFMLISTPYAAALVAVTWFDPKGKSEKIKRLCYNSITVYTYLVLTVLWWIVRNIIKL